MCPEFQRLKEKWSYLAVMLEEHYCKNRAEQVELAQTEMQIHAERCDLCNGEEHAIIYWQNRMKPVREPQKIKFDL